MTLNIQFPDSSPEEVPGEILVLFHFEDQLLPQGDLARVDWILNGVIGQLLYGGRFAGLPLQSLLLSSSGKLSVEKVLVLGLGRRSELTWDHLLQAYSQAAFQSAKMRAGGIALTVPEVAFESLPDDGGEKILRAVLRGAIRGEMSACHLNLAFLNLDLGRRDLLRDHLRGAVPRISEEFSTEVSFS